MIVLKIIIFASIIWLSFQHSFNAVFTKFPLSDHYERNVILQQLSVSSVIECTRKCTNVVDCIGFNWFVGTYSTNCMILGNTSDPRDLREFKGANYYQKIGNCTPDCGPLKDCVINEKGVSECICKDWPRTCGPNCTKSFNGIKFKYLEVDSIKWYSDKTMDQCDVFCLLHSLCNSYNYDIDIKRCHLKKQKSYSALKTTSTNVIYRSLDSSCRN